MVVRRYVVKDMPEAVLLIRKDLGKEAIILSTRKVYVKKWLGIWRTRRIEVMAAVGGDVPMKKSLGNTQNHTNTTQKAVHSAQNAFQELAVASLEPETESETGSKVTNIRPDPESSVDIGSLVREIRDLKGFIVKSVISPKNSNDKDDEATGSRLQYELLPELRDLGFSHEYGLNLIKSFLGMQLSLDAKHETQEEAIRFAKKQLKSLLLSKLAPAIQPEAIKQETRVALFVGPTGVGKTTTIAKLAALHVLSGSKKVGFLTTDTFRVAAVEQLKTYAGILNIPIGIIRRDEDMTAVFNKQNDRDLILIDTTGRNYRDPVYVEEMKELFKRIPIDETFLVLPMTGKISDLYGLTLAFERVKFDKFLFTKMDETSSYGAIVELLDRCKHPMSYVTTGQNVPDDLEVASLEKIVNCAFGEVAHT